jgi:hypothetical protein
MANQSQMKFSGKRVAKQLFQKRMTKMSLEVVVLVSPNEPSARVGTGTKKELRAWSGDWGFYSVPGEFGNFYVTVFPKTRSAVKAFEKAKKTGQVGPIAMAHDLTVDLNVSKIESDYMGENDDNVLKLFSGFKNTIVFRDDDMGADDIVRHGWRDVLPVSEIERVWTVPAPAAAEDAKPVVKTIKEK